MECDAKENYFLDSLYEITDQLTTINIKQLKFLCLDRIPRGNLHEMDGFDLIQDLHEKEIICHNDFDFLVECLILIGQQDVVSHLCSDKNHIDTLSCDLSKYKSNAGLSSFRIMLFHLANNINEEDVKKLILYLDGQPGISKEQLKLCISGFDLLIYLMKCQYVNPKDLGNLTDLVKQLDRKDLLEKIETYSEISKQKEASSELQQDEISKQEEASLKQQRDGMHLEKYTMTAKPRGICLIINNENFQPSTSLKKRRGSQKDEDELKAVFESFFFEVEVAKDLTREKIEKKLLDVAARDHKNYDCFVCCLLSHGVSDAVCGVDGVELSYESLILPFKTNQCHGLTGKPKLFFIQACQGKNPQMGVKNAVEMNGNQHSTTLNEADFLLACATVKEHMSFRSINAGSWFIQTLCQVLKENAKSLDLTDMLLIVNNGVCQKECDLENSQQVKQVPAPLSTLRKKVFFLNDSA